MIDIELIRGSFNETLENLARRGVLAEKLMALKKLDEEWRLILSETEELRAQQNMANRVINEASEADRKDKIEEMKKLSNQLKEHERELERVNNARNDVWMKMPN